MIINVAGTSGSGKSHLARSLLAHAEKHWKVEGPQFVEGRKAPIGSLFSKRPGGKKVFVAGAYDAPTGGCDTIHNVETVFDLVDDWAARADVFYEGLFVMNMTRGPRLAAKHGRDLVILQLTTPLGLCLSSVNVRRAARGAGVLEDRSNTNDNYRRATNYCAKMRDAGARVIKVSRDTAFETLLGLLEQ